MNVYKCITIMVLGTLFNSGLLNAADYYVDPAGSDGGGNNGSLSKPWKTINHAIGQASAGDTIHLKDGATFTESVYFGPGDGGTAANPVTITSSAGNRAIIQAPSDTQNAIFIYNTGGIALLNLICRGTGTSQSQKAGLFAYADNARYEYLHVSNCTFSQCGTQGIILGGWSGANNGFKDVLIENTACYSNKLEGMTTYADGRTGHMNITVRYCRFFDNLGDPSKVDGHSGSGLIISGVDGALVERCVAYGNGSSCTAPTGGPVGIWAYSAMNVTIQFCESYSNRTGNASDGGGFDLDGGCVDSVMQYNYSHGNDGAGYGIYQYAGAPSFSGNIVRYNISVNDGRINTYGGIQVWGAGGSDLVTDTHIYNNTVYMSPARSGTAKAVNFFNGNYNNLTFRNNLLITSSNLPLVNNADLGKCVFQGNCYWNTTGSFNINGATSLAAWRSQGAELVSGSPVGLAVDPLLTSLSSEPTIDDGSLTAMDALDSLVAYKLTANSPLIDQGLDLSTFYGAGNVGTQDFYGNSIPDGSYDVGAHEAGVAGNTPPAVNAGNDQQITLPTNQVSLDATVTDDGLPTNGTLSVQWTKDSGSGTVSFGSETAVDTTATFPTNDTYVLRLTATDGALTNSDTVTITVNAEPGPPTNTPPAVDAGSNQSISLPASQVSLDGTVSDDSLPTNGTLSVQWTKDSGAGTVTFGDASAVDTTATFPTNDTYVLRLTAIDGALTNSDTVTVTVNPEPGPTVQTTLVAVADTRIRPVVPNSNYGNDTTMKCQSGDSEILLRFDMSNVVGTITGAVLTVTLDQSISSTLDGSVYQLRGENASWQETTVTWNHRTTPATVWHSGGSFSRANDTYNTVIGTYAVPGGSSAGDTYDITLDAAVVDAMKSFGSAEIYLASSEFSALVLRSSEYGAAADRPQLTLYFEASQAPDPDADGDGMDDEWETANFGNTSTATTNTDSDADGMLDWQEFVAGSQPTNAASRFMINSAQVTANENVLQWEAKTGRFYNVYWSTSILDMPFSLYLSNVTVSSDGTLSVTDSVHSAEQRVYYRINVSR